LKPPIILEGKLIIRGDVWNAYFKKSKVYETKKKNKEEEEKACSLIHLDFSFYTVVCFTM